MSCSLKHIISILENKMTPPKSNVWRHFSKKWANTATSHYCRNILKTSENTTNLLHLDRLHKNINRSKPVESTEASVDKDSATNRINYNVLPGPSTARSRSPSPATSEQNSDPSFFTIAPKGQKTGRDLNTYDRFQKVLIKIVK